MNLSIRKLYRIVEETRSEGGKAVGGVCQVGVVAAVVENPLAGQYVEDLLPLTRAGLELGRTLAAECVALLGGPDRIAAFSKAALVGIAGELEHGAAIIHTKAFGNEIRKAARGEAPVASTEKRGITGSPIDLSIKGKMIENPRLYHQTFTLQLADAPFPSEIVVVVAGATMGRPQSRLIDLREEDRLLALAP